MKKILIKCLVLILVFIGGFTGTILLRDQETTASKGQYDDPTLPEVMCQLDGITINRMYGYKQKMQVDFMRDSLIPIGIDKTLNFLIQPYDMEIVGFSYEVRASDGGRILENKKLKNLQKENDYWTVSAQIESSILMNQEYSLQLTVETADGDNYYYYSRIVQRSNTNAAEYVQFAKDFSDKSRDDLLAEDLINYLETEETDTKINYYNIDIHSSWDEVSWGSLKPEVTQKGIPTIKDINETTGSVSIYYQVSCTNSEGKKELYQVDEFYRMRYSDSGVVLLDYNRSLHQIFDGTLSVLADGGLILGVRDKNVNYMASDDGSDVLFEQEGDLWSYQPAAGKLTRIFTFRKDEDSDDRDSHSEHGIKIIRVEDNGDADFVLYGYMNRGDHEGYSGISVFHYDVEQDVVEEKLFISSTESYTFLEENIRMLSYINERNQLFLLFADKLYKVNITQGNYEIIEEGIMPKDFAVSSSNAHASWIVQEDGKSKLKMINFDTCEIQMIEGTENQRFELIGYFNEDVIYGAADKANILLDNRGNEIVGMSQIIIKSFDGEIKKTYEPGYLITKVSIGDSVLEMELSQNDGGKFVFVKKDSLMNSAKISAGYVSIEFVYYERRGNLVCMALDTEQTEEEALVLTTKIDCKDQKEVILDTYVPKEDCFYVYAKGHLTGIYYNPTEAIQVADELTGVVLNRAQQYVWERGNRKTSLQLTVEQIPAVFLAGSLDVNVLQEGLGETGTVLDLTGCTLDTILYHVSAQRPVIVKVSDTETRVIVGYDEYNTWLYNPANGETSAYAMEDSEELFEKYGNVYLTYIENLER